MTGINVRLTRLRDIYTRLLSLSREAKDGKKTLPEIGQTLEELALDLRDEMMLLVFTRRE